MTVLDADTVALLEGGSALLIGTVLQHGAPHSARAWGLEVIQYEPVRVRVLLAENEEQLLANLAPGSNVAVTATDVVSFNSVQLKGTSLGVEPPRPGDDGIFARYTAAMYDDIESIDHTPRHIAQRLNPARLMAVRVDVGEFYDQTPGPGAGRALEDGP